jgi:hypothetical protein
VGPRAVLVAAAVAPAGVLPALPRTLREEELLLELLASAVVTAVADVATVVPAVAEYQLL